MSKLISLHQVMEIDKVIRKFQVAGIVSKSNYLEEGTHHLFPIPEEVLVNYEKGDKIRVTFFSPEDELEEADGKIRFRPQGVRYEKWNRANEGWDKVFEKMETGPVT